MAYFWNPGLSYPPKRPKQLFSSMPQSQQDNCDNVKREWKKSLENPFFIVTLLDKTKTSTYTIEKEKYLALYLSRPTVNFVI